MENEFASPSIGSIASAPPHARRFGGFLIVVAIWILFVMVSAEIVIGLIWQLPFFELVLSGHITAILTPLGYWDLGSQAVLFIASIGLGRQYLRKSSLVPREMTIFCLLVLVVWSINLGLSLEAGQEFSVYIPVFTQVVLVLRMATPLTLIPYFFLSKRVKATFVNQHLAPPSPLIAVTICVAVSLLGLAALGYGTEKGQAFGPAVVDMAGVVWDKTVLPGNYCRGWIKSLLAATPLLLTGLSVTIAFRAGVLNIGGEGQFLCGAIAATAVGVLWQPPDPLFLPALSLAVARAISLSAAIAAMLKRWRVATVIFSIITLLLLFPAPLLWAAVAAGAALAAVAAVLERWRNVPVVLSTLLLNFVAFELLTVMLRGPLQGSDQQPASDQLPVASRLPQWIPQEGRLGLHLGCALALVVAMVVAIMLRRTVFGFRLRMVGENPTAARFAGVNVGRVAFASLALSGAIAGLAGGIQISGVESYQLLLSMRYGGLGFAGIAVALLGRLSVTGVVAAALFFGLLNTAFGALHENADVPFVTGQATQGAILIAMLVLTHPGWKPRFARLLRLRTA